MAAGHVSENALLQNICSVRTANIEHTLPYLDINTMDTFWPMTRKKALLFTEFDLQKELRRGLQL